MDRNKRICCYSILISMYESGLDFVDCFVPIILQAVPTYDFTDPSTIAGELSQFFPIPNLMVHKILDRAEQGGYVQRKEEGDEINLFKLTPETVTHFMEKRKEVQKRISGLINDISTYFRNHSFISNEPILDIIQSFIDHSGFALNFIPPSTYQVPSTFPIERRSVKMLIGYLQDAQETGKAHLNTFTEIVMGSIVSTALNWYDISTIEVEKFRKCKLFLDTNFIFSILNFHETNISVPALELFDNLLKLFNFKLRVFDFTIEQIRKVMLSYSPETTPAIPDLRRPSVHNTLKKMDWTKDDVKNFLDKIEDILSDKGIKVTKTDMGLRESHPPKNKELADFADVYGSLFEKYKPNSTQFGKQHDLAAIRLVKQIRQKPVITINDPRAFFLTSDRKLTDFNQLAMEHSKEGTISEVVLDTSFASLLWLLQMGRENIQLSLDTIITAYSRNLFISEIIWERFRTVFEKLARDKRIDLNRIPHVFYVNIQNILNEFADGKVGGITDLFVLEKINEATIQDQDQMEREKNAHRELLGKQKTIESQSREIKELRRLCRQAESAAKRSATVTVVTVTLAIFIVLLLVVLFVAL